MWKMGMAISRIVIVGALAAAALEAASLPATAAPIGRQHLDFVFTGADQFFTVPANTGQVMVTASGAQGADFGPRGKGGSGDVVSGVINVVPGEILRVRVGGQGGVGAVRNGGWNGGGFGGHQGGPAGNDGGGGGGASDASVVKPGTSGVTQWVRVVIAGGGGGGGGSQAGVGGEGGDGGQAGFPGVQGSPEPFPVCFVLPGSPTGPGQNGVGGTGSTGLNCGAGSPGTGGNGTASAGGDGADAACCVGGGGGGGGGGFGGGGGGGAPDTAGGGGNGGGGGGSLGTHVTFNGGDGDVTLDWVGGAPTALTISPSPQAPVAGQPVTLSATVSPVPAAGTVQFSVDGQDVGVPVPVDPTTGIATSDPITGLAVGSHTFGGFYSGSTDFAANTGFAPSQGTLIVSVAADTDPPVVTVAAPSPPAGQNGFFNVSDLTSAGGSITVSASASDTSGTVTDLACTDNGQPVEVSSQVGSNPRTGTVSVSANGLHAIGCTATDSAGNGGNNGGQNTVTVSIDTTAPALTVPTVAVAVDATSQAGALVRGDPVTASDPDVGDVPAITCNPAAPSLFAIGDTAVTCQVIDRAGNPGLPQSFTVHVKGPAEQLSDLETAVQGIGPGASLAAKVRAAENSLSQADTGAACASLASFTREASAQTGKSIPTDQAGQLTSDATRIRNVIGCS
jgi:hypothetical protein